jgi:hypothetical protein
MRPLYNQFILRLRRVILVVYLKWTRIWTWMKQLVYVSNISAVLSLHLCLKISEGVLLEKCLVRRYHDSNLRWTQLLVIDHLAA